MDRSDVEFTVSLNTSPAEQQLDKFLEKVKSRSGIVYSVKTDSNGLIPTTPRNAPTTNDYNETNLPSKILTRELERIFAVYRSQAQGMPGWRYAGSSVWNEQRKIGYDNLPQTADNRLQETINFIYRNNQQKWRYAGSSRADSVYEDFEDLHVYDDGGVPPKKPPFPSPSADGNDTPAEQGKDIVEQEKKDNDELKEKLLLWSKIGATIYVIRKVLSGLAKLWKFGADTASGVNSNLNEEHGFFSIDPEGALRANTDKTRAIMYAGIRNMGSNAPVSKEGLDYASSKMTEMWAAAMSGRNVDARTTIDVQRLKDFFGIDLSVAGLLTGEREGKTATDIQIDMMDKVEKQISKLAEADEITKGQVIDSLKNILGDELVNAIVANANKNLKIDATDLKLTLAERIMQHGDSAIPSGNLTESTEKVITSLSSFNKAVQDLKNTVTTELGPLFSSLITSITGVVNWVNKKINRVAGTKNSAGEIEFKTSVASLTNDYNAYGYYKQSENDKADVFKNKVDRINKDLKSKSIYDKVEAMYLAQVEAESAADIENLGIKATQDVIGQHIIEGRLDENSANPVERALAKYTWGGFKGYEAFKQQMASDPNATWASEQMKELFWNPQKLNETGRIRAYHDFLKNNPEAKKAFISAFDKGGVLDFSSGMNIGKYLLNQAFYSSGEEYLKFWKEMGTQSHEVLDNTYNIETEWNDKDKNGRVDFGEVEVTLVVRDINGTIISKQNLQGAVQ